MPRKAVGQDYIGVGLIDFFLIVVDWALGTLSRFFHFMSHSQNAIHRIRSALASVVWVSLFCDVV